jgi:hypothetical protein
MVQVVASEPAVELIKAQGGRLYVWLKRARCCGGLTTLEASSSPPPRKEFRKVEGGGANFELFLPARVNRLPDELHLEVRRRSRRIEAYWNGCAWVT